ncbi:5-formyltetrahydrofolate cyclo-ligase [Pseudobacteroides cellulosolvens]|uniref:5-formyltetrahydrofolate cyclo-ligase n=1 Tax=Pseudobacteroides cellulosolvens ATCC 35603 = DSM 2933 TaxID=398512 RepID=A0A0L6JGG6_9FIRM|nr:5-formyltetrahydrofolate cyclo-ligase [Pseudobacteroides cellulosolvens]KNY24803.1 5-formyltetrahydrofolate cyclo-ligase [Pseudobacteroides cellulosolvens ATCC 35603 = DSM 2933]
MELNKEVLRKSVLEIRKSIGQEDRIQKSQRIISKLINLKEYKNAATIMCYVDFKGEVITSDILNSDINRNKTMCVPVVSDAEDGSRHIIASVLTDTKSELCKGCFGIMEPKSEYIRLLDPKKIDLVIVPGVVFDENRNRIGFGAGFYDRFLRNVRNDCIKVGLAYEFQIVDDVPVDDFDIPMDIIITEKRVIQS